MAPKPDWICGCLVPVGLPDMRCGACGRRRLGDDISGEQLEALAAVLAWTVMDDDDEQRPLCRRRKGRKRPRDRRT